MVLGKNTLARSWCSFAIIVVAATSVHHAQAAEIATLTPTIVSTSSVVEDAIRKSGGFGRTTVEGKGRYLGLRYDATDPLTVFVVPLKEDASYDPSDYTVLTLPSGKDQTIRIDLSIAPGWHPGSITYLMNLLAPSKETSMQIYETAFIPANIYDIVIASFRHLLTVEPYSPSSVHALRGQRMLGVSVTVILGISLIFACIVAYVVTHRSSRSRIMGGIIAIFVLLAGGRFGIDGLRITQEHVDTLLHQNLYDEAGSIYTIAAMIKEKSEKGDVFFCRTGTNFQEKLLRYLLYPIHVSGDAWMMHEAQYAVVTSTHEWSFEKGILQCKGQKRAATLLTSYPDDITLYQFAPLP